jgi:hypothetical protein
MKKILIYSAYIAVSGILLLSCQKEVNEGSKTESIAVDENLNISSDGTMLIFNTLADYERVVNDPTDEMRTKFLNAVEKMEHTTYAEDREQNINTAAANLIGDSYFEQIINKDNVVQIGTYLYLVDAEKEKVFVLPVANKSEYADLINQDTHNLNIKEYSTTQDVLYITQGSDGDDRCGGVGNGTYLSLANYFDGSTYAQAYVIHKTQGIYFSLSARAFVDGPSLPYSYTLTLEVQGPEAWRKRRPCNADDVSTSPQGGKGSIFKAAYGGSGNVDWTFYSNSRNLNGYYLFARAKVDCSGTIYSEYGGRNINSPY